MSDYGIDVLAIGPHPDDVELFCGGVLLCLADLGYKTGVVDLTRGELGSHGTPQERAGEAEAAARILGLSVRENLGLPDGWIHPWSGYDLPASERTRSSHLTRVVAAIRRHRPEILLVPWVEARHPDHAAAAELLTKAAFYTGVGKLDTEPPSQRFVPRQLLYYAMRHTFTPSFVVDTSAVAERKLQAIRCYQSQLQPPASAAATLIGSPRSLAAIEARDRYYGSMIGASHGEPLRSPAVLALADPVAHFRSNPVTHAYFFEGRR